MEKRVEVQFWVFIYSFVKRFFVIFSQKEKVCRQWEYKWTINLFLYVQERLLKWYLKTFLESVVSFFFLQSTTIFLRHNEKPENGLTRLEGFAIPVFQRFLDLQQKKRTTSELVNALTQF